MLRTPFRSLFLAVACLSFAAFAEETPSLQALPSADGVLSWWLVSPIQKEALETALPPKAAQLGGAVGTDAKLGTWKPCVSAARFLDFRSMLNGGQGTVWAACRVKSSGGARHVRAATYSALRIFVDGKEVLKKAQPLQPVADDAEAEIELPAGECELTVGMNTRFGYAGFQLNLTEGKAQGAFPKSVPGDSILLPAAAGNPVDSTAATLDAFTFVAKDSFVNPGQKTIVLAALLGSVPVGLEQISGRFVAVDGGTSPAMPARNPADFFGKNAWQVEFSIPPTEAMQHVLGLEITSGGKLVGTKKLEVYSLKGIAKTVQALATDIAAREKAAGLRFPNASLAAEKLILYMGKIESGDERISPELGQKLIKMMDDARRFADVEAKGQDPLVSDRGYIERAYVSKIDDSVQPYFAMVPSQLGKEHENANAQYPLVIFLHGYVPSYDKHHWWEEIPEFNDTFERHGAFMALPFGRSNTDFQSVGEVDVLDVIADMRKRYPIDANRIYLYGYSMGGMAVYHIAAHNPDLFAGVIAIAGRADSPLQNKKALSRYHEYKQWLIQADNPISLCENFLNIPLRIYHGNKDFVIDLSEAKRMEKRFKEIGANVQLFEMPGDHLFGFDLITTEEPLKWLLEQRRSTKPAAHWLKQYTLRNAAQAGVRITATNGALEALEVQWPESADGKIEFTKKSGSIAQLVANAAPQPELPAGLRKTPQRCGPVREAICNPFVIVYGTTGSPEANERNKQNAEKFAEQWFSYTRSRMTAKADKDITDAEKKSKNLFLFGEQQENALHAAAAEKLPIQIKDGTITIGAKSTTLKDRGAIFTYPSPFAPADGSQVVVVYAGLLYGEHIGANHKFDLLPDFLLYGPHADRDGTGTNRFYCAGFFDGEWKLNEKTTWWEMTNEQ